MKSRLCSVGQDEGTRLQICRARRLEALGLRHAVSGLFGQRVISLYFFPQCYPGPSPPGGQGERASYPSLLDGGDGCRVGGKQLCLQAVAAGFSLRTVHLKGPRLSVRSGTGGASERGSGLSAREMTVVPHLV